MSKITRRDFINGTLVVAGASTLPFAGTSQAAMAALQPSYYPPARTGLRGSHPGSSEHAHSRAWGGRTDWGPTTDLQGEYDLVVVGGGISGLSAAYFYQQEHGRDKKVLILDNHDDFGGHAKRNEHTVNGHLLLGEGGSESLEDPQGFSDVARNLIKDLGVDVKRFESAYDVDFFKRHNLGAACFFNKRTFGEDKLVMHPFCDYPGFVEGLLRPTLSNEEAVRQTPLSEKGKEQLLRVLRGGQHVLDIPKDELPDYVRTHSYFDYLKNTLGVDDPGVLKMARRTNMDYSGGGTDLMSISQALASGSMGSDPYAVWNDAMEDGDYQEYVNKDGATYNVTYPFIHHFPDGNATIARSLVKKMIPNVGSGETAEQIVLSKFNYAELDRSSNSARVRLNSTVVNVRHTGDPRSASNVVVTYIQDNKSYQVTGKGVVMACYNMMIPHIIPDLPEAQGAALSSQSKVPLQYTTVGVRNWRAMKEMGIGMAMCPGNIHQVVAMDYPVSMGGYEFTKTPNDPCILHMRSAPVGETVGAPPIEQFREARYRMLKLQFRDYEAEIREHLGGMLAQGSFDFDRDVKSISINRWAHAYAYGDPGPIGRQPFGRITIANSDAVDNNLVQSAVDQAWRAVNELR
ncbi:MAG: FAD-dependent oxidoreductase [Dehalococcoidia bacterium]|jgi:spermidine dehydrogenase|nr:FAD-dependent oxidoreductase [Dehalococcoidia bacterium]